MTGLKRIARRAAAASSLLRIARRLSSSWPRILMYHDFCAPTEARADCTPVDLFRQQLTYIKQHYLPLRLRELARALAAGDPTPTRSVVITVDDGYASFRRWALPLLQEFDVPATLFVVSDLADGRQWLWTDKFKYVRDGAMGLAPEWAVRSRATLTALKGMPPIERDQYLEELAQRSGVQIPAQAPALYALLSWAALKELAGSELVDIGSHSRTHAILASVEAERSWEEVDGSRRELERRLGIEITSFCYPNGLPADYRPDHVEMVAKAGYRCATASHFGCVTSESNPFALPRVGSVGADMASFCRYLDGVEYWRRRISGARCW